MPIESMPATHPLNPLRFKSGKGRKGKMPHQLSEDEFIAWLIVEGMNEDDYWTNVERTDNFARDLAEHGKTKPTRQLTPDQQGWAKHDHPQHFERENPKWFIREDKPSRPIPALISLLRNRVYNVDCSCDNPDYAEWGERHDGIQLMQCENCGEVILDDPRDVG
jgi:hypothetical protein